MSELTLTEAKEKVKKQEDSIKSLIKPQDLTHQNVESWENVDIDLLKDEIAMGMDNWTYGINHPYGDMILDLAVDEYVEDMIRIPFDDLNPDKFKTPEDAIIRGYWPYDMSKEEAKEYTYEYHQQVKSFHEYEDNIRMEIESAILDARLEGIDG